ncbi:formate dehydrogenase subunit gamma [Campylobacter sp. JMF_08 NE1]|uniref:formate dehydrogenase subunit gamma n=1 Tax=Campylobacter sp. JMF_08 NE1 TaxID=2983821 RepID=UPI0022E9B0B5|nr:formate dehydrogenase subunit gamma [Campylobacter sp. JMF_08 NE1]MDA3048162.1 formate dehydrogenase subunit gamma [Campylobacter sp. JMF_08 NE1]
MEKIKFIFLSLVLNSFAWAENFSVGSTSLWEESKFSAPDTYASGYAPLFVNLQSGASKIALIALVALVAIFAFHYFVFGSKKFSHNGERVLAFSGFERLIHFVAAISWVVLVPTGLIMLFGKSFGGGLAGVCKCLHQIATIGFGVAIIPMFLMWVVKMFPSAYDIKWLAILGGYLSKTKKPVPAGKFNAGQKMWFWVAILGGGVMIASGALMYFSDYYAASSTQILGLNGLEALRLSATLHTILGIVCVVFFIVHIYMSVFGVKGSISSMIDGYKCEEEIYLLHNYWYQNLVKQGKMQKSQFESQYKNL